MEMKEAKDFQWILSSQGEKCFKIDLHKTFETAVSSTTNPRSTMTNTKDTSTTSETKILEEVFRYMRVKDAQQSTLLSTSIQSNQLSNPTNSELLKKIEAVRPFADDQNDFDSTFFTTKTGTSMLIHSIQSAVDSSFERVRNISDFKQPILSRPNMQNLILLHFGNTGVNLLHFIQSQNNTQPTIPTAPTLEQLTCAFTYLHKFLTKIPLKFYSKSLVILIESC